MTCDSLWSLSDYWIIDLYLIEPPPDAMHAPIPPNLIVLGGDSAGGGLCLATLQVRGHCSQASAMLMSC